MASSISVSRNPSCTTCSHKASISPPSLSPSQSLKFPITSPNPLISLPATRQQVPHRAAGTISRATAAPSPSSSSESSTTFHGPCYVVGDNVDTGQIIPAEYLTLDLSNPSEYEKLGSYALCGLPASYSTRFVDPGETKSKYSIVIAGPNFGCGSSIGHAPEALCAAGTVAVVAESYARAFFRSSVATGGVYLLESEARICEEFRTGDLVTIELCESRLINHTTGKEYNLKPIGDAGPVIEAGGIFAYARKIGMIPSQNA